MHASPPHLSGPWHQACGFRPVFESCVPGSLTQCFSRACGFQPTQHMHPVCLQAHGVHTHSALAWIPAGRSLHMVCVHPVVLQGLQIPPHKGCTPSALTHHFCLASVSRPMVGAHPMTLCGFWPMERAHLVTLPASLMWPTSPSPQCTHSQCPQTHPAILHGSQPTVCMSTWQSSRACGFGPADTHGEHVPGILIQCSPTACASRPMVCTHPALSRGS